MLKRFGLLSAASACFLALWSGVAEAADISQCDAALVKDTSVGSSSLKYDYRLATLLTQDEWNKKTQGAGASATIYGVPYSASWQDQQDTVKQMMSSRNESQSVESVRQYAISQLSDNGRSAYETCVKALTSAVGLDLSVGKSSADVVTLFLHYTPNGANRLGPTNLSWTGMTPAKGTKFPRKIGPNEMIIISVPRPTTGAKVLNVQGDGAAQITVYPLIPAPKPPPVYMLSVDNVDDYFECVLNDDQNAKFSVGFGNSDRWNLTPHMKAGKNKLQCLVRDIHPDGGFNPCWHYHYIVAKNEENWIEHAQGTCGPGSQGPAALSAEYLYY